MDAVEDQMLMPDPGTDGDLRVLNLAIGALLCLALLIFLATLTLVPHLMLAAMQQEPLDVTLAELPRPNPPDCPPLA